MTCNIDNNDRINRAAIGTFLIIASFLGASQTLYMIFGIVMIVQAMIGWCSIPYFLSKFRKKK